MKLKITLRLYSDRFDTLGRHTTILDLAGKKLTKKALLKGTLETLAGLLTEAREQRERRKAEHERLRDAGDNTT